jgi:uncharacterized protein YndB with AHSA1/START domain
MERVINEEIHIEASPDRVFEAWTEARHMMAWWGQEDQFRTIRFESDLRVGGTWRARFRDNSGNEFGAGGEYLRVEPPTFLSFTWKPEWNSEPPTTIELEFREDKSGTLFKFRQHGFTSDASLEENRAALESTLGWLRCYFVAQK